MKPQWKWIGLVGVALLAFAMSNVSVADHYHGNYGGYGYGTYGYGQSYPSYSYPSYSYPSYSYPSYGYPSYGSSGFYNRTEQYHYTHPRVTTGYGFGSYAYPSYSYPAYSGYGRGGVSVRYPGGGVDVGYGRSGGGVRVYNGYRGGINIGW